MGHRLGRSSKPKSVLTFPSSSLRAVKYFHRWSDVRSAWYVKLHTDRMHTCDARQRARREQLKTAGIAVEKCARAGDPVYDLFLSNERSILRLGGLRNPAAITAEIISREKEGRLGAPLLLPGHADV